MKEREISLLIVSSGSLPLLSTADLVILMEGYQARGVTEVVKGLAEKYGGKRGEISITYKVPKPRKIQGYQCLRGLVKGKVIDV